MFALVYTKSTAIPTWNFRFL